MVENIRGGNTLAVKVFKYWLPVLGMLGAMYYFSTDVLSGENTRGLIINFLNWLGYHPSTQATHTINYFVRKAAHFIEYAFLAALCFRAFRADSAARWRASWAGWSLFISVAWALADEFHQTFTRERSGSVRDSLIDTCGAFFMLLLIAFFHRDEVRAVLAKRRADD